MFTNRKMKLLAWQMALLLVLCLVVLASQHVNAANPSAPLAQPSWESPITISSATQQARRPKVAASPSGSPLVIVYIGESTDDPYFSISTNQGVSWSTPTLITDTALISAQVLAAVDYNNRTFAVWTERISENNKRLVVSTKPPGGAWSGLTTIAQGDILDPNVIVDDNNNVHVVWTQGVDQDIYYAYRAAGSSIWSTPIMVEDDPNGAPSWEPSVAVGGDGRLYLAWHNDTISGGSEVVFSQGTVTGPASNPVWNPSAENILLSPPEMEIAAHAVLSLSGSHLNVAYTRKILAESEQENDKQDIFLTQCTTPCNSLDPTDFRSVSGNLVEVNGTDPSELISAMARDAARGSWYIYFNGIDTGDVKEAILGVNSCEGGARDVAAEDSNFRYVKPSLAISNGWLHLVYDQISSSNEHLIQYRRAAASCEGKLYLPIIRK